MSHDCATVFHMSTQQIIETAKFLAVAAGQAPSRDLQMTIVAAANRFLTRTYTTGDVRLANALLAARV